MENQINPAAEAVVNSNINDSNVNGIPRSGNTSAS